MGHRVWLFWVSRELPEGSGLGVAIGYGFPALRRGMVCVGGQFTIEPLFPRNRALA